MIVKVFKARLSFWLVLMSVAGLQAQNRPEVEIIADLLELFEPARVVDSSSSEIRRPASAGGVKQDALFEHPRGVDRPAQIQYQVDLPAIKTGDLLLFAFDIGLADGIKLGGQEDGVRFAVELEGKRIFVRPSRQCRWESHAVDLGSFAGRSVKLTLLTEAMANTSFDWAVWGTPRILHFRNRGASSSGERGKLSAPIEVGAVAFTGPSQTQLKLCIKPKAGGAPVECITREPGALDPIHPWMVKEFSFAGSGGVEIDWEPKDVLSATNILVAAHSARLKIVQLSPARSVITAGETVPVRVELKNTGRGRLEAGETRARLRDIGQPIAVPALGPNEAWRAEWDWKVPEKSGRHHLELLLSETVLRSEQVRIYEQPQPGRSESIENEYLRVEFPRQREGYAYARIFVREGQGWAQVGVWNPLFRIGPVTKAGEAAWDFHGRKTTPSRGKPNSIQLTGKQRDADGAEWECQLAVSLEPGLPAAQLRYEWKATEDREIKLLLGPNIYVGEGVSGEAKSWGLFPGLEYLYGAERSSNPRDFNPPLDDRRTPHPHKITVPLMAVSIGPDSQKPPGKPDRFFTPDAFKDEPLRTTNRKSQIANLRSDVTVALLWDPSQRWDGEHAFPSARFASPNFDEGAANHRLGLFLPSAPEFVPENADRASEPYRLAAGKTLTLEATLVVAPGPATVAVREWLRTVGGLPKANPWPRSFQQELDVCRAGFLKTLWDEKNAKWRHCIDWASSHAPGFAALLWLDSRLAEEPEARRQSHTRVELVLTNMLRDGPGSLTSQANCHIMQWELPFLCGHLPEAMAGLDGFIQQLIKSQDLEGGWRYEPGNAEQARLGRAGDSVLGTCANKAATLLRYARITGDAAALAAGEKALRFMERFRVPRGGQTWECPMYEPDILAAAYGVRACHDAYRVTGNARWLHNAVYWAESGVPFIYLWTLPERPMMLGATIPVFGSTFYTHTWLGVPVQWCGLVYAYHVFHLAEELKQTSLPRTDSPLPLALNFSSADWKRVVELVTVSGMYQQFADGERIGAYPDSITKFEQRNPAFLNPEDILVNVLALKGYDPDVKTARVKNDRGEIVISSGARINKAQATAAGVRFQLNFFAGELSHSLLTGVKAKEVVVDGKALPPSPRSLGRDRGWWWDETHQRLYLSIPHEQAMARVEIR